MGNGHQSQGRQLADGVVWEGRREGLGAGGMIAGGEELRKAAPRV